MLRAFYRVLLQNLAALEAHKLGRWRDLRAKLEGRIEEVQHLHPQNGVESADEVGILPGRQEGFLKAVPGLLRWLQPQYFVRGNQRPFNVIHRSIKVSHDRREPLTAEIVGGLLDGGGTAHVADQFGGLELIRGKGDSHMAVRDDAFVVAVGVDNLADVLRDEIRLQAIARHIRQGIREDLHSVQRRKFIDEEQQAMTVMLLLRTSVKRSLRQAVDGQGEDQADERTQPDFVAGRHHQVKRYRAFVVDQVVDGEVAGRSVVGHQRIAVERQRGFGRREHSAKVLVFLIEHLLHFLANHRVRDSSRAIRHPPLVLKAGVVFEIEQLFERVLKAQSGASEQVREIRQAGLALFERRGIAGVQDHAGGDGGRSILPVALLGTIFAGADDHAGNVLRVTDIPWSEQPHLAQRIEAGSGLLFDRCELEANMPGLSPKTGGLGPVLAFDVVDDSGFRPRQESRNHQADAFAAAGRGESQDMFGAVVPQVVQTLAFW